MFVLERNQNRLCRPKRCNAGAENHRRPDHEVHPIGRLIGELNPHRQGNDNRTDNKHHEDCWTVTGIVLSELQITDIAMLSHLKIARIKPPTAALGTAAQKAGTQCTHRNVPRFSHVFAKSPVKTSQRGQHFLGQHGDACELLSGFAGTSEFWLCTAAINAAQKAETLRRPTNRPKQTRTTRQRQQSANTRLPPQNQCVVPA